MANNKVLLHSLDTPVQLGNNGLTLQIKTDDDTHRGYLKVGRAYIEWYKGKEAKPRKRFHIDEFISMCEEKEE